MIDVCISNNVFVGHHPNKGVVLRKSVEYIVSIQQQMKAGTLDLSRAPISNDFAMPSRSDNNNNMTGNIGDGPLEQQLVNEYAKQQVILEQQMDIIKQLTQSIQGNGSSGASVDQQSEMMNNMELSA